MTEKFLVLRTQRNEVLGVLKRLGLDHAEFEWSELYKEHIPMTADAGYISVLRHVASGYYFEFDMRKWFWAAFSPGRETPREYLNARDWDGMLGFVGHWAGYLKKELDAPDLWDAVVRAPELGEAAMAKDRAFTNQEREMAREFIGTARQRLLGPADLQEHTDAIITRLNYLEGAIDRMSRRDWLHTAIGVIFTIVAACGLSPDVARELVLQLWEGLRSIVRIGK